MKKEWTLIKPFSDLYHTLFTNDNGMSQRKVIAYYTVLFVAAKLSFSVTDEKIKADLVYSWQIFAGVCLGLVTVPELIKFLNKGKDEEKKDPTG